MKQILVILVISLGLSTTILAQEPFVLNDIFGKWEFVNYSSSKDYDRFGTPDKGTLKYKVTPTQKLEFAAAKTSDLSSDKKTYFIFNADKTFVEKRGKEKFKGTWQAIVNGYGREEFHLKYKGDNVVEKWPMYFERFNGESFINFTLTELEDIEDITGNYTESVENLIKLKKVK